MYKHNKDNLLKISNIKKIDDIHMEIIQDHPVYPLHTHDFLECFLVVKGRGVHYNDGLYDLLLVGSFIIIPDGSEHAFIETEGLEIININLFSGYWFKRSPLLMRYIRMFYKGFVSGNRHLSLSGQAYYKVKELILWAIQELNTPLYNDRKSSNMLVSTIIIQIFMIIIQSKKFITNVDTIDKERNLYAKQNIKHDITDLIYCFQNFGFQANFINFIENRYRTYNTFLRYFKRVTGHSPKSLQLKIILFNSRNKILRSKDTSITNIAKSMGFNDMAYFSKLFKKEFALNPSDLRK